MEPIKAYGYFLTEPNRDLEPRDFTIDGLESDEAIIKVAGCGLCHTDIGFLTGSVNTKQERPIILGHEISGRVVAAGRNYEKLIEKNVVVPAVLPCGECDLCKNGRDNICQSQKMPGNDFHGGFASHVKVPARFLCPLPEHLGAHQVADLSVVADAVTTPYQSLVRSKTKEGDLAVVIGVGGIGIYMVQHAKNAGATVIAIDIDEGKLKQAQQQGADYILSAKEIAPNELKKSIRGLAKENNLPKFQWKVFETSGTAAGQTAAFSLMSFAGTVGIVGFTMEKVNIRLSNMMAFDADLFGNWGCSPSYYPIVVADVLSKRINILDNVKQVPLDSINQVIAMTREHRFDKRAVFLP